MRQPRRQQPSQMSELWNSYATAAGAAGCPPDQFKNFAKAGIVLNPTQLKFAAACRAADHGDGPREIGFGGARSGGKSHVTIAQLGADDCQRFRGLKCLLLRKAAKSNIENFQDLRGKIFKRLKHVFLEKNKTLFFANQSRIVLGHFLNERDIDNYLGLEYDVIAVEEATTLSSSKLKQIQTCCRTSKPGWRPRMYSNTNPGGTSHAFYRAKFILPYRNKRETDTRFIPSRVTDCPQTNADYIKILNSLTGWQLKAWRDGDWDIAAGQYFTNFSHPIHVEPAANFDWLKVRSWFLAMDYGFQHYTCVLLGAECDDGMYIVDEHCYRQKLPAFHADGIKAMLGRHFTGSINDKRKLTLGDIESFVAGQDVFAKESDGKSIADTYLDLGIRLKPASMDRVNGWSEIMNALGDLQAPIPQRPRLFIHPRCVKLIECLPVLEHNPDKPEDVLKVDCDEDGIGGDDPCLVAGTLVTTKRGAVPIEQVNTSDKVLTRLGWQSVLAAGKTGVNRQVCRISLWDGREIICTPNHKVMTRDGWKRADELDWNAKIYVRGTIRPVRLRSIDEAPSADVYDLEVESQPEFYANGILVHNCDTLRYMLATKARRSIITKLRGT